MCRDLERSLAFYAAVFGPLGLEPPFLVEGERGEQIHYLRFPAARLRLARAAAGARGAGVRALCARACTISRSRSSRRADVDAAHAAAVEAGAEVLHEPRFWPQYHPEYYATFFLDPDGFRIEVALARDARRPI